MRRNFFYAVLLSVTAALLFAGCGPAGTGRSGAGEPTVIRVSHNYAREIDPHWRDPVTGDYFMNPLEREARLYAERQVLEKLNVVISWIDYDGNNPNEFLLRSVLAGDPAGEIIRLSAWFYETILAQNVLQPLESFADIFDDEESGWILNGKVYGHNFFLNDQLRNGNYAPLVYNIGMLNRVPALRENGKTVLPVDLWLEGRWTWSEFEDYLQKVNDFYVSQGRDVMAYGTYYPFAGQQAMHSNGASIYGNRGLEVNTAEAKEAIAFLERLISRNLLRNNHTVGSTDVSMYQPHYSFQRGDTVFHNIMQWNSYTITDDFNERGDTVGVVPFPRPDRLEPGDPRYGQVNDAYDCYAIPKGISREMTELTLRAWREYMLSYYRKLAGSDQALDFLHADEAARASAMRLFLDVTNSEYGEKILAAWKYLGSEPRANEFATNAGLWGFWNGEVLNESLLRINGASSYAVQVETKMPVIEERMNMMQRILAGTELRDNIPPNFTDTGVAMAFPVGTVPNGIDWGTFVTVRDNVDGDIDFSKVAVNASDVNFGRPGRYENAVSLSVSDTAGNERTVQRTVVVFDGGNRVPPRIEVKEGFRTLRLGEETRFINWGADFVASAVDRDGLDVSHSLVANLAELDTTEAGDYDVTLSVKDYADNENSVVITVTVAAQ